jgi:large conductance mechanosensitive channel
VPAQRVPVLCLVEHDIVVIPWSAGLDRYQCSLSRNGQGGVEVFKGFRNFLMRGDIVTVAVGLAVALAFSALIAAFTVDIIKPIVARAQGSHSVGLGIQLGQDHNPSTFINFGALISSIIYFAIFMAVVYFVIVVPYRHIQAGRGQTVFGDPAPVKTCPYCLSSDLPAAASKCRYCGSEQPAEEAAA